MKTVVLDRDVIEEEVKPHAMLEEYRQLLSQEVKYRLAIPEQLIPCICPGCHSEYSNMAFEKSGLVYMECRDCKSLYISPRPSEEALEGFYRNSKSSNFWREQILPKTKEKRRTKLFRPRAQWLLDVVDEYCSNAELAIVIGYHNDLLLEELHRQEKHLFRIIVTNPIAEIEFARASLPGVEIRPTSFGELANLDQADVLLAFDILDRCNDLDALFASARTVLAPGGLLLATTILISGFDLQVMWDQSESIYPPERMNLLSVEGLTALLERHSFEVLEFSTPGMFDVEAVTQVIRANPDGNWPRFIQYLVENRDETALNVFQEYLQRFRLSSFARIVLRKPE